MTRFEAIKQGHIKIVDISIVCNFTVDKCELNPAYVIKNIDSPKDLLNGQKKRSSSENRISYSIKLADEKYRNWDWNYGKSPEYNVRRGTKFPSGKVEIFANVIESKIQDIKIYGDFFGIEDVAAVEDVLRGVKYEREDVLNALQTINLGRYFAGITAEEIAEAVVE